MATLFKDDNDREWRIRLTLGKARQIREDFGLDLLDPWDGKAIDRLTRDTRLFAEVMAVAVDFGAEGGEIGGAALAEGLRGEGLDRAHLAFWRDVSGFFVAAQREAFLSLVAKTFEAWEEIWNDGKRKVSAISVSGMFPTPNTPPAPPAPPTSPPTAGT